jgi:chorismate mutase
MAEVHITPDEAWSDAAQQITPARFIEMNRQLLRRNTTSTDPDYLVKIENYRSELDDLDEELINLISRRMQLVREIGAVKKQKNIAVLQPERFRAMREALNRRGSKNELSPEFIALFLEALHQESINQQERIMNPKEASQPPSEFLIRE